MMEPLSALAIATGVAQFVGLGYSIATGTVERYQSLTGTTAAHDELEGLTERLIGLIQTLGESSQFWDSPNASRDERVYMNALRDVVAKCQAVASELLAVLADGKASGSHKLSKSFMAATRSKGKDKAMRKLKSQFVELQKELTMCLALINGSRQSAALSTIGDVDNRLRELQSCVEDMAARQRVLGVQKGPDNEPAGSPKQHEQNGGLEKFIQALEGTLEKMNALHSGPRILDSLRYPMMSKCENNLADAHPGTLGWVLDSTASNFRQWLGDTSSSWFWVAGKPGAGKTTLMKFLRQHSLTKDALHQWAGQDTTLIIAEHFFGSAGLELQRSLDGFLMSLLEQALVEVPGLIPVVCPRRWEKPLIQSRGWSRSELIECVQTLLSQTAFPVKLCLFVDALDECDGRLGDLLGALDLLIRSPNVKVCASSREWTDLEDYFQTLDQKRGRTLRLQQHTGRDIHWFVEQRLERVRIKSPGLVGQVVARADGVFLWVFLICDELARCMRYQDSADMLQRKLDSLPATLEDYFLKTLQRPDPSYRRECAHILLAMLAARRPLDLLGFRFLGDATRTLTENRFEAGAVTPLCGSHAATQGRLKHQIRSYARDMIDILPLDKGQPDKIHLAFQHSTVKNFLTTSRAQEILRQNAGSSFNAHEFLCRILLLQMNELPQLNDAARPGSADKPRRHEFYTYLDEFAYHVRRLEQETNEGVEELLACLDSIFLNQSPSAHHGWLCCCNKLSCRSSKEGPRYERGLVIAFAVQHGLIRYVERKLDQDPLIVRGRGPMYPLLRYALCHMKPRDQGGSRALSAAMVNLLLKRNASPMQRYLGMTPWTEFTGALSSASQWGHGLRGGVLARELEAVIRALLQAGAPASAQLELRQSHHGDLRVRLVYIRPLTWLWQELGPVVARPSSSMDPIRLALMTPTWAPWQWILNVVRSTRIILWVGYMLAIRWIHDAIRPHSILDIATILVCLSPSVVLVATVFTRWDEGVRWLEPAFVLANIVGFLRCLSYSLWERDEDGPQELRPQHCDGILAGESDTIRGALFSFLGEVVRDQLS
ncbi:hypothetical protein B0T24DRAFT_718180 [Lasiosphaeria ovina]|uniref:NACHT domain-containing protein n=1 Tax=Lasiosphaeria ovina TaxID=92902 RepID=A0AAE0KGC3_9PEZI|nr:hypothetical protein B0T24DRAFT_718180 [Lasiosphaeria ovina]